MLFRVDKGTRLYNASIFLLMKGKMIYDKIRFSLCAEHDFVIRVYYYLLVI